MTTTNLAIVVDGVLGLATIAGGIVLLALGKIDTSTGVAVIAAGAAIGKGATSSAIALKVPAPPQTVTTPTAAGPTVTTNAGQ
jgi:hypothetical protein